MKGKRAEVLGEGVITLYRILSVAIIALVIFGVYTIFYTHHIDVRDSEARLLGRDVIACLAPGGVAEESLFNSEGSLLRDCGYNGNFERYYISAILFDGNTAEIASRTQGDSGLLWIRDLLNSASVTDSIQTYRPGYYKETYDILYGELGTLESGTITLEVLVNAEE